LKNSSGQIVGLAELTSRAPAAGQGLH